MSSFFNDVGELIFLANHRVYLEDHRQIVFSRQVKVTFERLNLVWDACILLSTVIEAAFTDGDDLAWRRTLYQLFHFFEVV